MEVMGIKMRLRSFWMLMSPGNFPNQLISHGAKWMMMPVISSAIPAIISQRDIVYLESS